MYADTILVEKTDRIREELGISKSVAEELMKLAGDDEDLVIECSRSSRGLSECKARIIDARFNKIEGDDPVG